MSAQTLLTDTEYSILEKLWDLDRPVSLKELLEIFNNEGRTWKLPTLKAFVARLLDAGYLDVELGKRYYLYKSAIDRVTYEQKNAQYYLDQMHDGSYTKFLCALTGGNALTPEQEDTLNDWILQCKERGADI